MNVLTNLFGRLSAANARARQQRDSLLQQKRERFLNVHKSDTPPHELLASSPRRLSWTSVLVWIYLLLFLLVGVRFFERTVVGAFKQVEVREVETQHWIDKQAAESPRNDREVKRHRLLMEVSELEAETARQSRRTLFYASIPMALMTIILPVALLWLFLQIRHLLRNGRVIRAEFFSRKLWPSSAGRLRFATNDGKQVRIIRTVPLSVPIGTKLWVLYAPGNPKRALVYYPDDIVAKLLSR